MLEKKKRDMINKEVIITSLWIMPFIILSLIMEMTVLPFIIAYIIILLALYYKEKTIRLSRLEDLSINGKEVNNLPYNVKIINEERDLYQVIVDYKGKEYYSDIMYGIKYVENKKSINLLYTKDNYILSFDDFRVNKPLVDSSVKLNIRGIMFLVVILLFISELTDYLTNHFFENVFLIVIPNSLMMLIVLVIIKQTIRHKQKMKKIKHLKTHGTLIRNVYCENKNWFSVVSGRYHEVRLHKIICEFPLPDGSKMKLISDTKDNFSYENRCNLYIDLANPKIYYIEGKNE
jgi:hypothetical protein